MGNSQWIVNFQYRGCDFSIDCDENGFIQNQMASNKVIPLSKSVEQPQGTVQEVWLMLQQEVCLKM